jgi:hypothetical protein
MSTTAVPSTDAATEASARRADLKLEVITLPVTDLDRAPAFRSAWATLLAEKINPAVERYLKVL